eukprot:3284175-Alexandrium_andersonii.AAC.1
MLASAKEVFGLRKQEPRKPWISDPTLQLIAQRQTEASEGDIGKAETIDKLIKASAKEDKKEWLRKGLANKLCDPVRILSRKSPTE